MKHYSEKDLLVLSHLRQDARMKLTDMSRATRIPVSTLFDKIRTYEMNSLIKRSTSLVRFEDFGYQAKALIILSINKKHRQELFELLNANDNVNSLLKINNGCSCFAHGSIEIGI